MYLRERQLASIDGQNPIYTIVCFIGASILFYYIHNLVKKYRTSQARRHYEERVATHRRKASEEAVESASQRRKVLSELFVKNLLLQTLEDKDIKELCDECSDENDSNGQGFMATLLSIVNGSISMDSTISLDTPPARNTVHTKMEEGTCDDSNSDSVDENDDKSSERDPATTTENDIEQGSENKSGEEEVTPKREGQCPTTIPTTCAICLENYVKGDVIVWSGNQECNHVYHSDCILDYLMHQDPEVSPCPCCRRVFIQMKE